MAKDTVTIENGINSMQYAVHAHDAADPATTPNGTPYLEAPNGGVFAGMITIAGGSGMRAVETEMPYSMLFNDYEGFFVVHDPMQDLSTTDLTTYLVLGLFAR